MLQSGLTLTSAVVLKGLYNMDVVLVEGEERQKKKRQEKTSSAELLLRHKTSERIWNHSLP